MLCVSVRHWPASRRLSTQSLPEVMLNREKRRTEKNPNHIGGSALCMDNYLKSIYFLLLFILFLCLCSA